VRKFQKAGLAGHCQQPVVRLLPAVADAAEDRLRGRLVLDQLGIFGGDHHDFDQRPGVRQLGLDAGARRQVLRVDPCAPDLVHRRAVADVGDPDGGLQHLRLVRAAFRQQAVDVVEDLLGLAFYVLVDVLGDDAGEVDGVAVLHGLGQDGGRIVTRDAHGLASPLADFSILRSSRLAACIASGSSSSALRFRRMKTPHAMSSSAAAAPTLAA